MIGLMITRMAFPRMTKEEVDSNSAIALVGAS